MSWPFGDLPLFGFDCLVIDPPWHFNLYSNAGNQKAASSQYDVMNLADIKALPVGQLARAKAILFLWACAPMLPEALDVMKAWGFTYKTMLAWRKITPAGKPRMGCGYVARSMHEPILVGAIGHGDQDKALPSVFDGTCLDDGADLIDGIARQHSRKPDSFYDLVRQVTPRAERCDLFSRETREGFTGWGREHRKFDEAAE